MPDAGDEGAVIIFFKTLIPLFLFIFKMHSNVSLPQCLCSSLSFIHWFYVWQNSMQNESMQISTLFPYSLLCKSKHILNGNGLDVGTPNVYTLLHIIFIAISSLPSFVWCTVCGVVDI